MLGIYLAFAGFVSVALSLRYETAIVPCETSKEAAHLVVVCAVLALPVSLISTGALYFLMDSSILGFGVLPQYTVVLAFPSFLLIATFLVLRYWFVREESFAVISRILVAQNGARAVSQIGFGLLGLGWVGLLVGDMVGRGIGSSRMLRSSWYAVVQEVNPLRSTALLYVLKRFRKFPMYSLPSSLVDALALNLPIPLVAQLYGPQEAGYFTLVQRVLAVPLVLIGSSFADSFHARISRYAREMPRQAVPFFLRVASILLALGVGLGVLIVFFGQTLFGTVFGEEWAITGLLAAAMMPSVVAALVVSPLSRVVFVFQGQELKLVQDVLTLLAVFGVFFVGYSYDFSLLHTIGLLSFVQALVYIAYFVLLLRIVTVGVRRIICAG